MPAGSGKGAMARAIVLATPVAGTLDIGATILTNPQVPARFVLQSVAGGWLGAEAYQGGWRAAWLGLPSHFAIMLGIAAVFVLAAVRIPAARAGFSVPGLTGSDHGRVMLSARKPYMRRVPFRLPE